MCGFRFVLCVCQVAGRGKSHLLFIEVRAKGTGMRLVHWSRFIALLVFVVITVPKDATHGAQ